MSEDMLTHLGPLAPLVGAWEGDAGIDISPGKSAAVETRYRECLSFEPLGPVVNGPQVLYGLRYSTTAWPLHADEAFHEELGYWLWDAKAEQVMRCFMVPRGVNIMAGGSAHADATHFSMTADVGSQTFGILSNPFLDQAFKTVRYELRVDVHGDGRFSYDEDTQLQMPRQNHIFHHTDRNTLTKTG
ncbi:MAG: heme-binding beta-barrel domain-containing protein [Mariprofundaceae bacterium]